MDLPHSPENNYGQHDSDIKGYGDIPGGYGEVPEDDVVDMAKTSS